MRIEIVRSIVFALACAIGAPAAWGQSAPDRRDVVQAVSDADPARFACAHVEGRACKMDWIKAVAWALHQTDTRWGLNMKRDDDRQGLSMDVVTFRIGPTDRHVEAFDICGGCGGGSPSVVWQNITNYATLGQPGTARWVRPEPVAGGGTGGGGTGGGTGGTVPPPPVNLQPLLDRLAALEAALGAKLDGLAAVAVETRDAAKSAEHDARELNAFRLAGGMDLTPLLAALEPFKAGWPEYSGRVFGTGVTLRPKGR